MLIIELVWQFRIKQVLVLFPMAKEINSSLGFHWKSNQETGNQFRGTEVKANSPVVHENRETMMAKQRYAYNKSPSRFVAREGSASFTPYKRTESNEQRGTVVKRCHNCGSDRHLIKF